MVPRCALVLLLIVVAVATGVAGCAGPLQQPAQGQTAASPGRWLGSSSCAATGCHNANGLKGELRSEYTTWVSFDPHARAYEVLFNDRSRTIAANFDPKKRAHENSVCLNCHVHRDYDKELAAHHARFAKEDGVGCESCHGAARDWVSEHYKNGWRDRTTEQKLKLGFQDTRSLIGRVRSCTPCHVGAEGMDVNHDLIAAGHPRLAFDFSAYHALMPHHWQKNNDKPRSDWDAAAWFVGEALTTEAALELLASRAKRGIWPEFAEYDCYACHHQLQGKPTWRQSKERFADPKRKLGSLPWSDWYAGSPAFQVHSGKTNTEVMSKLLLVLRSTLEEKPDPPTVRAQAERAAAACQELAKLLEAAHYTRDDVAAIFKQVVSRGASQDARSWDDGTRNYLALIALLPTWPGNDRQDIKSALTGIRKVLQFGEGSDSPQTTYTPRQLRESYRPLQGRLGS
jgi:hypothetical protein